MESAAPTAQRVLPVVSQKGGLFCAEALLDITEFEPEATDIHLLFEGEPEVERSTGVYITVMIGNEIVVVKADGSEQR